jgi:predicted secreted Zn-dependent protease
MSKAQVETEIHQAVKGEIANYFVKQAQARMRGLIGRNFPKCTFSKMALQATSRKRSHNQAASTSYLREPRESPESSTGSVVSAPHAYC